METLIEFLAGLVVIVVVGLMFALIQGRRGEGEIDRPKWWWHGPPGGGL